MKRCALILAAVLLGLATAAHASTDGIVVTASAEEHIWFVAVSSEGDTKLHHHARDMDGPFLRTPIELPDWPIAMAARGSECWLIFDKVGRREVYSVRARRDASTGLYFYDPPRALTLEPALPDDGRVAGMVAGPRGPVVLLVPHRWTEAGVRAGERSTAAQQTLDELMLLNLTNGRWEVVEGPDLNTDERAIAPAIVGSPAELAVITRSKDRSDDSAIYRQTGNALPVWTRESAPLLHDVIRMGSRTIAIQKPDPARTRVGYLRGTNFIPLAELDELNPAVVAMTDMLAILRVDASGELTLTGIDPVAGTLQDPAALRPQPLGTGGRLVLPVVLTVATLLILAAVFARPGTPAGEVRLPPRTVLAEPSGRLFALLFDITPAVAVVSLARGESVVDVLQFPLWASSATEVVSLGLVAALTALHSSIGEWVWQASFGKALVGLKVYAVDGGRPAAWRIGVRNIMKAAVILVPPLAVFILLSPTRQRVGDVLAGTIVVRVRGDDRAAPDDQS